MKTKQILSVVISSLALIAIVFYSCKKDDGSLTSAELQSAQDESVVTAAFNDIMTEVDDVTPSSLKSAEASDCRDVKVISGTLTSETRKYSIDYGTGCIGKSGRTKSGKIYVEASGKFWVKGWTRIITLSDFKVNERRIEGTKTVEYLGLNSSNQPYWKVTLKGGKITFKDSTFITREFVHFRTLTAGYDSTSKKVDGVIEISGSGNGTTRKGDSYSDKIVTPLVFSHNCKHIKSGSIEITVGSNEPITITYENENCSGKALIEKGEKSKEIDLD